MSSMLAIFFAITASCSVNSVAAQNNDLFNYAQADKNENGVTSRGQPNWGQVRCGNAEICTGFPNKFPAVQQNFSFYQWDIDDMGNNCKWCPESSDERTCGVHRQSPIDMLRYVGEHTEAHHKECKDWHWMQYKDDTCTFERMKSEFEINRHALQIWIPVREDGMIDCWEQGKGRRFPRLDYSKGFPDWWYLQRTDISVPSQHTQEGFRYAAEVTLAHFYQIGHHKNELGYVTLFMQDYPDEPSWPYLDKLICQWREKEEKVRAACGEPPAPPYGRCRIFSERGQQPTEEWLEEAGMSPTSSPTDRPSVSPSASPSAAPSTKPSAAPTAPPSSSPTAAPSPSPSAYPTLSPTAAPSRSPVTSSPVEEIGDDGIELEPDDAGTDPTPRRPSRFRPSRPAVAPNPTPTEPSPISPRHPSRFQPLRPAISPSSMPTAIPTILPSASPISPTPSPSASPSVSPTATPSAAPTSPSQFGQDATAPAIPPEIDCANFDVPGGYDRMCHSSAPCCDEERAETNYCWNVYENVFPGSLINSACYHCCPGKEIGPEKEVHPEGYIKTIQCSDYNAQRYCKQNSCCERGRESSPYCEREFEKFSPVVWEQMCWYCCQESHNYVSGLEIDGRGLLEGEFLEDVIYPAEEKYLYHEQIQREKMASNDPSLFDEKEEIAEDTVVMYAEGRMFRLQKEDLEPSEEDPEEYFYQIYDDFKQRHRRMEKIIHEEDYEDVHYWPYEWMLHVGTEYYFRYEGTQPVPPCREFVHWRVMKDPMRVHPRQIAELNRLMAWRLNPDTCRKETAGVVSNDGNSVDVSREIQYRHHGHRDVFCECKDWPSKFENDKAWCRDWEEDLNFNRFYWRPYSFDTGGQWLPGP